MTTLYAQPYDLSATGFYFEDADAYRRKAAALRNDFGAPVEEFDIQFIDGARIDAALADAIGLSQATFAAFFEQVAAWDDHEKLRVIIAVGACGYDWSERMAPDDFEVDIYAVETLRALAEQFVEEGLFGDIPAHLETYIDYDAMARDLAFDYAEIEIAGQWLIYRCA